MDSSSYFLSGRDHSPNPAGGATANGDVRGAGNSEFGAAARSSRFVSFENLGFVTPQRSSGPLNAENSNYESSPGYGGSGRAGGKLRSSSRRVKKTTPYDRPATGRHATPGGSVAMPAVASIASRIKASASYVFNSLFKLRLPSLRLTNGDFRTATRSLEAEEKQREVPRAPSSQDPLNYAVRVNSAPGTEKKEFDIGEVEEVLKQRTLSREQVNRLTEFLQTRICESSSAQDCDVVTLQEQPKKKTEDSIPVQVTCSYMGEEATETPVPSHQRIPEDRYTSPVSKNWTRSSLAIRMPKRRFICNDNDDGAADDTTPVGNTRRVRQRTPLLPTASPYLCSRRICCTTTTSRMTVSTPPARSSQTAQKILDTLEKLSPTPKGKALECGVQRALGKLSPPEGNYAGESGIAAGLSMAIQSPETSRARENHKNNSFHLDMSDRNLEDNTAVGGSNATKTESFRSSTVEQLQSPLLSGSSFTLQEKPKGFRMSAVFEESNSDEESKPDMKASTPSGAMEPRLPPEGSGRSLLKTNMAVVVSPSPPDASVPISSSLPVQCSDSPLPDDGPVMEKPTSNSASSSKFLFPSTVPTSTDTEKELSVPKVSTSTQRIIPLAPEQIIIATPAQTTSQSTMTVSTSSTAPEPPVMMLSCVSESISKGTVILTASESESILQASITSSASDTLSVKTAPIFSVPEPTVTVAPLSSSDSTMKVSNATFTATPASTPPTTTELLLLTPSVSASAFSTVSKSAPAHDDVFDGENVVNMATENPVVDKVTEVDTMATDSMAEEAATSLATELASTVSTVPTFSFGASSTLSTSPFSFTTSSAASSSGFTFGGLSGATQAPTFAPVSSPFSSLIAGNSSSSLFRPSSTTSSALTSNSTPPSNLTALSSPFQFGATTTPSASSNIFGSGNSSGAFSFSSSSASNVSSGVTLPLSGASSASQPSSALSGQLFTFGSAQSNPFASQNCASNPFATSVTSNTAPNVFAASTASNPAPNLFAASLASNSTSTFQFGSSSAVAATPSSSFSFGATGSSLSTPTIPSTFPFGSTAAASSPSSMFPFGSSTAALSTSSSSVFSFGSTPAAPSMTSAPVAFSFGSVSSSPAFSFSSMSAPAASPSPFGSTSVPNPSTAFAFGSTAVPNSSTSFSFGPSSVSTPPSSFTFGSAQPTSPSPFAFGGQTTMPSSNGQPFSFGGQPGAPVQSPFSAGGFALGATGGEKAGRKIIKAKRRGK